MQERSAPACGCTTAGKIVRGMCATHYDRWVHATPKELRGPAPRSTRDFWSYVDKAGASTGYWLWTGPVNAKGYGLWSDATNGERGLAHRVSLARVSSMPSAEVFACHHCDNPPCVNPEHLYWGTVRDNARDAVERGRAANANRYKTYCKRGHPLSGDNLQITGVAKSRQCRTCGNDRSCKTQAAIRAQEKAQRI